MKASILIFILSAVIRAGGPADSALIEEFERASKLHAANDFSAATAAYQKILDSTEVSGKPEGLAALVHNSLGSVYQDLGRFDEAEQSYRRALLYYTQRADGSAGRARLGVHVLANLGSLYLETHQIGRLRETAKTAAALLAQHADDTAERARLYHLTGLMWVIDGQREKAAAALRESLAVWSRLGPGYGRQTADVLNSLGTLTFDEKRYGEALHFFSGAIRQFDAAGIGASTNRAATQTNLACSLLHLKRYDDAEAAFGESMRLLGETVGLEHPYTANAILSYATALEGTGRKKQAREHRKRAERVLEARRDSAPSRHVVDVIDLGGGH